MTDLNGWRPIAEAPKDGRVWLVSDQGEVTVDGVLKSTYLSRGYVKVSLRGRVRSVHRLVAAAFCKGEGTGLEVNHINGNKADNRAVNLEWCTRSENMRHAYALGLHPRNSLMGSAHPQWGKRGVAHRSSVAVRAVFRDGSVRDFASQLEAERAGFRANKISMCINGRNRTHAGATWQPLPAPPAQGEG